MRWENKLETFENMFLDLTNIIEVDLSNIDTSRVSNMMYMFSDCTNLSFFLLFLCFDFFDLIVKNITEVKILVKIIHMIYLIITIMNLTFLKKIYFQYIVNNCPLFL